MNFIFVIMALFSNSLENINVFDSLPSIQYDLSDIDPPVVQRETQVLYSVKNQNTFKFPFDRVMQILTAIAIALFLMEVVKKI